MFWTDSCLPLCSIRFPGLVLLNIGVQTPNHSSGCGTASYQPQPQSSPYQQDLKPMQLIPWPGYTEPQLPSLRFRNLLHVDIRTEKVLISALKYFCNKQQNNPAFSAFLLRETLNAMSFVVFQGINVHKGLIHGKSDVQYLVNTDVWTQKVNYWRQQGGPISSEICNAYNLHRFQLLSDKSLQAFQCAFDTEQVNLRLHDLHTLQSGREQKRR